MKKILKLITIFFLGITITNFVMERNVQAAMNPDGSITINAENFPDEGVLKEARMHDRDRDSILSSYELENSRSFSIYSSMYAPQTVNVQSMSCFYNMESVDFHNINVVGSFKGMKNLKRVKLYLPLTTISLVQLKETYPLNQLKNLSVTWSDLDELSATDMEQLEYLEIEDNFNLKKIDLCNLKNVKGIEIKNCNQLESLDLTGMPKTAFVVVKGCENLKNVTLAGAKQVTVEECSSLTSFQIKDSKKLEKLSLMDCESLKKIDIKKNTKLKSIVLENTSVKKLDLRKNKQLKEVAVQFGECRWPVNLENGQMVERSYFYCCEKSCKIQFPKNNKIKTLRYFTKNASIDVSECKSLRTICLSRNTMLYAKWSWYKKNKKKIDIYAEGLEQTKLKTTKIKKKVKIATTKYVSASMSYITQEELDKQYDES